MCSFTRSRHSGLQSTGARCGQRLRRSSRLKRLQRPRAPRFIPWTVTRNFDKLLESFVANCCLQAVLSTGEDPHMKRGTSLQSRACLSNSSIYSTEPQARSWAQQPLVLTPHEGLTPTGSTRQRVASSVNRRELMPECSADGHVADA